MMSVLPRSITRFGLALGPASSRAASAPRSLRREVGKKLVPIAEDREVGDRGEARTRHESQDHRNAYPDPDQGISEYEEKQHDADVLVSRRVRLSPRLEADRCEQPEGKQDHKGAPERGRQRGSGPPAKNGHDGESKQRGPDPARSVVRGHSDQRPHARGEPFDEVHGAVHDVVDRYLALLGVPPARVPGGIDHHRNRDHVRSRPRPPLEHQRDGDTEGEHEGDFRESQRHDEQTAGHRVAASIAALDGEQSADPGGHRCGERDIDWPEQDLVRVAHEEERKGPGKGEPRANPAAQILEQQHHAGEEGRRRDHRIGQQAPHAERSQDGLVDQYRAENDVLDVRPEQDIEVEAAPVEQVVPLIAGEAQMREQDQQQDARGDEGPREDGSRIYPAQGHLGAPH